MIIAITGTPGTGKTSVAQILKEKKFNVIDFNKIANEQKFFLGIDKKRNSKIIDTEKFDSYLNNWINKKEISFVEGHLSHLLKNVDYVILLRMHPEKLKKNLLKKKWLKEKIKENIEAELLDIILCEAIEIHGANSIFEIDTTEKTIEEVALIILDIVENNFQNIKNYKIGSIDWSEELFKDF
jgi:adenylate kinase